MPETAERTVKLSDILGTAQLKEVKRILNSSPDSLERVRRLKDYFGTFADDLERQGILPAYLAYAVEYMSQSQ